MIGELEKNSQRPGGERPRYFGKGVQGGAQKGSPARWACALDSPHAGCIDEIVGQGLPLARTLHPVIDGHAYLHAPVSLATDLVPLVLLPSKLLP